MPPIGDYFGERATELAGIIVHPASKDTGLEPSWSENILPRNDHQEWLHTHVTQPYCGAVGNACRQADVLDYTDPEALAAMIPYATVEEDGYVYHAGRYAPDGLYGSFDPATRNYEGIPLNERCRLLQNKANALAISVETGVN